MKAIRCKCGCIYPDDMAECPSCRCTTGNNQSHVLTESKKNGTIVSNPSTWKPVETQITNTQQPKSVSLTPCQACSKEISIKAEFCPHCGHPTGVRVCPKCGSIKTKPISGTSKATSIFLWGPFAANKVLSKYQCRDCGHKW